MNVRDENELIQVLWDYNHLNQPLRKAEVMLVLGSHDLRVADYAAELFLKGFADLIIFSGDSGRTKSWQESEAVMFSRRAEALGVPRDRMVLEDKSTNTGENVIFSKALAEEKGIPMKDVLLVQKPYMERRAFATFKRHFPDADAVVTSPRLSFEEYVAGGEKTRDEQINLLVGDTQKIRLYPARGFMVAQQMPEVVVSAYKELVARGYDKHVLPE